MAEEDFKYDKNRCWQGRSEAAVQPDLLGTEPFYKNMIANVQDFYCGNDEFGVEATYWIHGQNPPSVKTELNKKTQVWLYRNFADEIVGFGSLGLRTWTVEGGTPIEVQYVPMLGVFYHHQGLPKPSSGIPKYCYQIVNDLVDKAELKRNQSPLLGLCVRPDNEKAIHVYKEVGFQPFMQEYGWNRMILDLR